MTEHVSQTTYTIDDGTTLVNVHTTPATDWDVYIGRQNPAHDLPHSPHHNPFIDADLTRIEALANYKMRFYYQYLTDTAYRTQVHDLAGQTLACQCLPEPCHGEVILDLLDAVQQNGDGGAREFITNELHALDSRNLCPTGIADRARLEEHLGLNTGFTAHLDDR